MNLQEFNNQMRKITKELKSAQSGVIAETAEDNFVSTVKDLATIPEFPRLLSQ